MVVVDRNTKRGHFEPTVNEVTAEGAADIFLRRVWSQHGLPDRTVSDRGTQFNNRFMRRLYDLLGIESSFSTAFHPQTDGQSERVNQYLEQYLRAFVSYQQDNWASLLPMAEFAYNNSVNSSTGYTPFFANNARHPRFLPKAVTNVQVPAAEERASALAQIQEELKSNMAIAAERVKYFYDKHVAEQPSFEEGSKVWLRSDNVKTTRPTKKLDHKLLGPFTVVKKLSSLTYKLELPPTMKNHPVFHVGLLEPYTPDPIPGRTRSPPGPIISEEGEAEADTYEVEEILDSRRHYRKFQYFVHWKGYPPSERSWIPWQDAEGSSELIKEFHHRYPDKPSPRKYRT